MQILYDGSIERRKEKKCKPQKTQNQTTQNPKTNKEKPNQNNPPHTYTTAYVIKVGLTQMFSIKGHGFPG